jgi:hypothetical protein
MSRSASRAAGWTPPVQNPLYKIPVTQEGIYRMTGAWLQSQGVDTASMVLDQVRLYNLGQETATYVYDQNGNNRLDAADYIEFYGRPVTPSYAKYTNTNIYWLTDSGYTGALRMASIDATPGTAPLSSTYDATVRQEQDELYILEAPGADTLDRWFSLSYLVGAGTAGGGDPVDFTLSLEDVAGQGSLTLSLWGFRDTDHEVDVSLNGLYLDTLTWSGIAFYETTIPAGNLLEGDNVVTLTPVSGSDPEDPDTIIVDWMQVDYPRGFTADNNTLKFSYDWGFRHKISGFTQSDLVAFDVSSADDVKRVLNGRVTGMGAYTLEMEPQSIHDTRTYLILSEGETKTPASISEDTASSLADDANGADYILITHHDLGWNGDGEQEDWLNNLVALRQAQGLRVKVVDVNDIYDEFSYGLFTPQAIRDFLQYAYENWTPPAPQYVLLAGDASYDYKDNLGVGTVNFVPSYAVFTEYMGETLTDEWFATISGDDAVPDLYIGRLPVSTKAQAAIMVDKIITYENAPNSKTWQKNTLLVSDNQEDEWESVFETINQEAAALIPPAMNTPSKEYLADYEAVGPLRTAIKDKINHDGTLLVNYSGHGSWYMWADENIFNNTDAAGLTNTGMLPFFVAMTCMNGYFAFPEAYGPDYLSMAEVLLRAQNKGAIAAFMSTSWTEPTGQRIMDRALFNALFTDDLRRLGPAVSSAKQVLLANGEQYEETSESFLLFGDPAMTLKVPLPHRPTGFTAQGRVGSIELSWQAATDANGNPVAGYNLYRSATPGGAYSRVNTALITGTAFTDSALESGSVFYYVVRSVDEDGDESVSSEERGATVGSRALSTAAAAGGGGGGGCFINTVLSN